MAFLSGAQILNVDRVDFHCQILCHKGCRDLLEHHHETVGETEVDPQMCMLFCTEDSGKLFSPSNKEYKMKISYYPLYCNGSNNIEYLGKIQSITSTA